MNLFGTVLTYTAPSANYRGESIENRAAISGGFQRPNLALNALIGEEILFHDLQVKCAPNQTAEQYKEHRKHEVMPSAEELGLEFVIADITLALHFNRTS